MEGTEARVWNNMPKFTCMLLNYNLNSNNLTAVPAFLTTFSLLVKHATEGKKNMDEQFTDKAFEN